ncbi:MAG: type I DNA topoisomerase [Epsilonproteobacteria bacterium]|nr:type I DNA topoisomerase [Campylobacterota bacterium]
MKNLIIVESPAKAKTISHFLGKDYKVIASKGHIRDLPKSSFGITIKDGKFVPKYVVSKDVAKTVDELKSLAKVAKTIYIATDEDREGEAIGYHIAMAIKKEPTTLPRIVFHEITKTAISHALENPRIINMDSVNAQQTRRLLDRVVGYKLSPLLASKIQKGLSAGRVQSSALKIVVDREREIEAFEAVEYWSVEAVFEKNIHSSIISFNGKKLDKMSIENKQMSDEIVQSVQNESFIVEGVQKRQQTTKTPPPFMTSTLQQSASTQLGFSPKKTMMIAQKLYEGVKTNKGMAGIITYMRTDSLNLATEAITQVREHIKKHFGEKYLPNEPKSYVTKAKMAQEAHEAIRPTTIEFSPLVAKDFLSNDELKLYTLIYNRFVACQMMDAKLEIQTILFNGQRSIFKANGKRIVFDGFYRVTGADQDDKILPPLEPNLSVTLYDVKGEQHFTEPPARYNEASLIKKLESVGIGRPSTYAPTINILETREYIEIEKKRITPTKIAFTVTELLEKNFDEIVNSNFTSSMEDELDLIAEGKQDWQETLKNFYEPFMKKIEEGKANIVNLKVAIPTGEPCPSCGSELLQRKGRYGEFIACSNFPECKYTRPIKKEAGETEEMVGEKSDEICDKCGSSMVIKESKNGKFLACSAYPTCRNAKPLNASGKVTKIDVACPKCGKKIIERIGRRGKFYGCEDYPTCTFISNAMPTDTKCSQCGTIMSHRVLKTKEVWECLNSECKHKDEIKIEKKVQEE